MTSAPNLPPRSSGSESAEASVAPAGIAVQVHAASTGPNSRSCLNCGAPTTAQYCAECGQRVTDPDPTLRELVEEMAGELLHWDGKLWSTLKTLIRWPGALTLEYVAGKRASYISPLRLYLTASVVYFFLAAVAPESASEKPLVRFTASDSARDAAQHENGIVVSTARAASDTTPVGGVGARFERRIEQGVAHAAASPREFTAQVRGNIEPVVFIIVPAFAFAVGIAYGSQRRHFPQHLVFALHVHAVAFLGFALVALARFTPWQPLVSTMEWVVFTGLLTYVVMALRRVYGGSIGATIAKTLALGLVYLCFFGAGMVALVLYGFYTT
jgi:Protein of unknown function (DUF3667)